MPTERFLKFEEIHSHTGLNLFNTITDTLKDFKLDLKDCRGHNASNISGNTLVCRPGCWKKIIKHLTFLVWHTH